MKLPTTRATPWRCDNCKTVVHRDDDMQDVPPSGWRLLGLWPTNVNLALEASHPREIKRIAVCAPCFHSPGVDLKELFADD